MLNAAFQAGYRRTNDAFYTVMFAVVLHCVGENLTPFDLTPQPGRVGEGDLAEQMIIAMRRGAAMNTDLGEDWDFWPWLGVSVEVARARLGVPPLPGPLTVGGLASR